MKNIYVLVQLQGRSEVSRSKCKWKVFVEVAGLTKWIFLWKTDVVSDHVAEAGGGSEGQRNGVFGRPQTPGRGRSATGASPQSLIRGNSPRPLATITPGTLT